MKTLEDDVKSKAEQVRLLSGLITTRRVVGNDFDKAITDIATSPSLDDEISLVTDAESREKNVQPRSQRAAWRTDFDNAWGNAFLKA